MKYEVIEWDGSLVRYFYYQAVSHKIISKAVMYSFIAKSSVLFSGPGSSVGIATELRAGRSGIESRWGRDFPPVQTVSGAHPAFCKIGIGSFPGVEAAGEWG